MNKIECPKCLGEVKSQEWGKDLEFFCPDCEKTLAIVNGEQHEENGRLK